MTGQARRTSIGMVIATKASIRYHRVDVPQRVHFESHGFIMAAAYMLT